MNTKHLIGLLCASSALLITNATVAQQENEEREAEQAQLEELIVVEAPRVVRQQVGRSPTGAPIELISLTRRVSYADLDLQLHPDVMELERRINDTAEQACMQLAELFPLSDTDMPTCVRQALAGAMEQAEEAIAAAGDRAARRR